ADLFPVECDQDTGGLRAGLIDDLENFPDRGAGGDHVVKDQYAALDGRTYGAAALAVILALLAVERERIVVVVMLGKRRCRQRDERNALVGGAAQHVDLDIERRDGRRVTAAELRRGVTAVEQAGVEEVRADPPGLQLELTELQYAEL